MIYHIAYYVVMCVVIVTVVGVPLRLLYILEKKHVKDMVRYEKFSVKKCPSCGNPTPPPSRIMIEHMIFVHEGPYLAETECKCNKCGFEYKIYNKGE